MKQFSKEVKSGMQAYFVILHMKYGHYVIWI